MDRTSSLVDTADDTPRFRFGPAAAAAASPAVAAAGEIATTGRYAFGLLLVFLLALYSNISLLVPAVEILRPAQVIGALALAVLIAEKVSAGESFEFVKPGGYWLAAFIGAAALTIPTAFWQGYAFDSTLNLVKMAVVYVLIVNTVTTEKRARTLLWVMCLGGLFPALGTLRNWHAGVLVEGRASWIGIFSNANELAYAMVVLVPFAGALAATSGWLKRMVLVGMIGIFSLAAYLSFSRGSLLGLFAVLAYMGLRQKSHAAKVAMVIVLIAGVLAVPVYWARSEGFSGVTSDASFNQRLDTYRAALAMFADHPVTGVGIACSSVAWPFYAPRNLNYHTWLITHNTFLELLSETGLLGFIAYMMFLLSHIRRAWVASRNPAPGRDSVARLAAASEISTWGFIICGLSGGYVLTWFPYIVAGLAGATSRLAQKRVE